VALSDDAPEEYCRQIESYLCRKNEGHLIRIVGPAFEQVCGWAVRGIPIKVAYRGIDRCVERYYAKGPRRRPVRIEFCEADVLDVFDEWRRAVGVPAASAPADGDEETGPRRHASLPAHLERVIARLTTLRSSTFASSHRSQGDERAEEDRRLDDTIDRIVRELDTARAGAKALRGEARERLLERLRALDRALLDVGRGCLGVVALGELQTEADAELAPFRDRMPVEAYARSREAAVDRLVRDRARLPVIAFE
jgi:hypothetical protein